MNKETIILYGAGMEGEKFYWKHKEKIEILYCVDRNCNRNFHDIPVYALEDIKEELIKNKIVVAATQKAYKEIRTNLQKIGLVEWEHFVPAKAYRKKLAVLYGNCHMNVLKVYLSNNPYFEREYYIKQVSVMNWEEELAESLLSHCDLLICQDIREDNGFCAPSAESLRDKIADIGVFIKMINVYGFHAFFPQMNPNYHSISAEADNRFRNATTSHVGNNAAPENKDSKECMKYIAQRNYRLEELLRKGANVEHIKKDILNSEEDYYKKERLEKDFNEHIAKMKEREAECDIVISDYIEANYQEQQLFYDPYHPVEVVVVEKGRRILNKLGIPLYEVPIPPMIDYAEQPIYAGVKNVFGMKFGQKCLRGGSRIYTMDGRALTIEEYIEDYVRWIYGDIFI